MNHSEAIEIEKLLPGRQLDAWHRLSKYDEVRPCRRAIEIGDQNFGQSCQLRVCKRQVGADEHPGAAPRGRDCSDVLERHPSGQPE